MSCDVIDFFLYYDPVPSPDQGAGASADSSPPTGLGCICVTVTPFVRLQVQLLGESSSALVAGVEGEVLSDADLGGAQRAAVVRGILAVHRGGGGGGAMV